MINNGKSSRPTNTTTKTTIFTCTLYYFKICNTLSILDHEMKTLIKQENISFVLLGFVLFYYLQKVAEACANDPLFETWSYFGDTGSPKKNCRQIRNKEERRQILCQKEEVRAACPQVCGFCCEDERGFQFKLKRIDTMQDCRWITKNQRKKAIRKKEYCTKDNSQGKLYTWEGRSIRDACPVACDFCFTDNRVTLPPSTSPSSAPNFTPIPTSTTNPSDQPTRPPSPMPSPFPSTRPSIYPSDGPSLQPSISPSFMPSNIPSISTKPSDQPTRPPSPMPSPLPSTSPPSDGPSLQPSISPRPSNIPSISIKPSSPPSDIPSRTPSDVPSDTPSYIPTVTTVPSPTPCLDLQGTFTIDISQEKTCKWLTDHDYETVNQERRDKYCGRAEVRFLCTKTCGYCPNDCNNDISIKFALVNNPDKYEDCKWINQSQIRDKVLYRRSTYCSEDYMGEILGINKIGREEMKGVISYRCASSCGMCS